MRLPTADRVVALTFDACEQGRPVKLDRRIADYLVAQRIAFTIFVTGTFARDNAKDLAALAALPFVEIENHSWNHPNRMTRLSDNAVEDQVLAADRAIFAVTQRRPQFFRFPAGNYNNRILTKVESLGYRAIQWSWATGDPDPHESADRIVRAITERTRAGDILIMHINGRGVHTADALPRAIAALREKGFGFVRLADFLAQPAPHARAQR